MDINVKYVCREYENQLQYEQNNKTLMKEVTCQWRGKVDSSGNQNSYREKRRHLHSLFLIISISSISFRRPLSGKKGKPGLK